MRSQRAVVTVAALVAVLAGSPAALARRRTVVVNEVYGGGGNAGATLTNDFIELANRGDSAVDVSGWSVQYHPAARRRRS